MKTRQGNRKVERKKERTVCLLYSCYVTMNSWLRILMQQAHTHTCTTTASPNQSLSQANKQNAYKNPCKKKKKRRRAAGPPSMVERPPRQKGRKEGKKN